MRQTVGRNYIYVIPKGQFTISVRNPKDVIICYHRFILLTYYYCLFILSITIFLVKHVLCTVKRLSVDCNPSNPSKLVLLKAVSDLD